MYSYIHISEKKSKIEQLRRNINIFPFFLFVFLLFLGEELGKGAFSRVYCGLDFLSGWSVAIKQVI